MTNKPFSILAILLIAISCSKKSDNNNNNNNNTAPDNPVVAAADTITSSTRNFKGVNWADPRDNFADDWLILSGLSASDNETAVGEKAEKILSGFQSNGANTVRLPVNPSTVLQTWWPRYSSVIKKASSKGMKVILAYWEGNSSRDGKVDNTTAFWEMWTTIMAHFSNNANIYFEVFNEPHGYSATELKTLYAEWLGKFPTLAKRRIILDGVGYATDVNSIGADSRFDGCLLSFHFYTWFGGQQTSADWEAVVRSINYQQRTITTEFGVPMTSGKNYGSYPGSDKEITYLQAMTEQFHDRGIGSVYWPGLRTGDSYSMFGFDGNNLSVNNATGLSRLKYAWGTGSIDPLYGSFVPGTSYKIINKNSGKALDVSGGSTSNGGSIIQWDYSGGANQQWSFTSLGNGYFTITNKNSGKMLDINGASQTGAAAAVQMDNSGAASQQWRIVDIGFGYYKLFNKNSGQSLDVNGGSIDNGGSIIQWYWNCGSNQQWQIVGL